MDRKIVNVELPGIPALGGGKGNLMAVLTQDGPDDMPRYSVYVGIVEFLSGGNRTERSPQAKLVAAMGTKQSLAKARAYFPGLNEETYNA